MPDRIRRRTALRLGAAVLASGAAAGCAARTARPQPSNAAITLKLQPLIEGGLKPMAAAQAAVMAAFEKENPGVRVQMSDPAGSDANIAAILAGHGPDVFWDFHYAPYLAKSALLRLDDYLTRDNVDPDIWSAAQMSTFRTATPAYSGTFALPCFFGTMVYVVNLDDLRARSMDPPSPDWTFTDFVAAAQRLSGTDSAGNRHYGASMQWYADQTNDGEVRWLFNAFRGTYVDATGLAVQIAAPEAVAAGEWIYEELLWPQAAIERDDGDATPTSFASGRMSMAALGHWDLKNLVQSVKPSMHFDFHPFPIFPAGRTSFGTDDFYAIAATTRYPEQAWALLQWLSAGTEWQRAQIQLQLLAPALNALWPEWVATVQKAAAVLNGKAVHWFADAATGAYALPPQYFAAADAQAQSAMGSWISRLHGKQILHVDVAFQQAQNQINALVASAAAQAAQAAASRTGAGGAGKNTAFAAPPQAGMGQSAQPATGLVQVGGGGYTLTGMGGGVLGAADGCVYACLPLQQAGGSFVCRLTALAGQDGGRPDPGAAAGLMVRGDLSDAAAALALEVTAGRGTLLQARPQARAAVTTADLSPAAPPSLPLWLRLDRQGLNWAAFTSADGTAWTPAGAPQPLAVAGCWVGLYATANGGRPVAAAFDHVGFTATGAYRIGSS